MPDPGSQERRQLQIGTLTLGNRYLMAPLAGITDSAFRRIVKRQGAALVYTEMISAKALDQKNRHTGELLAFDDEENPVGVQLFGHEPDVMARAAEQMSGRGFALIDINMGCPVPKVVKNGEGSALLREPKLAQEIVREVIKASDLPVTVKMRIGFDEQHINAVEFAMRMEEAGAAAVTVHARTREQYYSGEVRRDLIRQVREAVSIPVIGNGDVRDRQSADIMFAQTGCDAVMIGRGAIGNPWIFKELLTGPDELPATEVTSEEKAAMLLEQARLSVEEHGEKTGIRRLRGIAGWYFKGMHGAAKVRDLLHQVSTYAELEEVLERIVEA